MSSTATLADQIDAEFAAAEQKIRQSQQQRLEQYQQRQQRIDNLENVFDQHRDIWRSRLETLAERFADRMKVTPRVVPGARQATLEVESELARIVLRFSVAADEAVENVVFRYDLDIVPIYMKFDAHSELQFPLDDIDSQALGQWIDRCIMGFVHSYLAMHENAYYLKDHLVEDPVAKVRFPRFAAAAKLDRNGKTIYFISEETRRQYEENQNSAGQ